MAHSAADFWPHTPTGGICLVVAFQSGQSRPLVTAHEKRLA
jgi:hypothetical protein